ncbi:MAG: RNA polymerase sigma factor [Candidatus Limnocylindria bacterium]
MSTPDEGAGLLARVAGGDRDAFTRLVEAHDAEMARLCFIVCGDPELARDATQNAWQRLWHAPPQLRDATRLRSWLLSVAANEARQLARRRRRGSVLEGRHPDPQAPADPGTRVERLDVARLLAELEPRDRELLALRYVLGLSSPELARQLGISPEGVRSRLHRLVSRLRTELDQ